MLFIFFPALFGQRFDKIIDEQCNVLFAFAQRRQGDWEKVEPVKKDRCESNRPSRR
jgi:hypothetical protein